MPPLRIRIELDEHHSDLLRMILQKTPYTATELVEVAIETLAIATQTNVLRCCNGLACQLSPPPAFSVTRPVPLDHPIAKLHGTPTRPLGKLRHA